MEQAAHPTLIMLVGPPGSGKSFLGRLLVERLGAKMVQTDALRKAMFKHPQYTGREHAAVYAAAHRQIERHLRRGETLVFDATNLAERKRKIVYRLADQAGADLVIVVAYAPPEVIRQRLLGREAGLDPLDHSDAGWSVYLEMRRVDPIPRPHLVVNTVLDLRQAVDLVAARVKRQHA
jgi:predicted kinase